MPVSTPITDGPLGGVLLVLILTSVPAACEAADAAVGRDLARQCQVCHGIDGVARIPEAPTIAGESVLYLTRQLRAFRSGERHNPQMSVIAKGLSDDDIANLAAWYSSIEVRVTIPE